MLPQLLTRPLIIAVDGPAGSGKSSICSEVCRQMNWSYVNTGALYRGLGYLALARKIQIEEGPELLALANEFARGAVWDFDSGVLSFRGESITQHLNESDVAKAASLVAKYGIVRESLLPLQRKLGLSAPVGAMLDGRDIGTVVFPDADLKVFMTASIEERARRRFAQLTEDNKDLTISEWQVKEAILARDQQDSSRHMAPLMQSEDAVLFDNSDMEPSVAVEKFIQMIRDHGL
jgi:cytidylate kinase